MSWRRPKRARPALLDFTIKPAPSPAEQAHNLVTTKKPETMDFAEWQLVLSEGSPEDAAVVWNAIKGKSLQFQALLLISASPTSLDLAASVDDIDEKERCRTHHEAPKSLRSCWLA